MKCRRILPEICASTRRPPGTWCWAATRRRCPLTQLRLCAPCQNFGIVLRNQNRMLEVRRRQAIRRAYCPAVVEQSDIGRADVNHRLNRERHSRLQFWSATAFAVIGDLGLLMHFAPNAVPNEFAHDRKTISAGFILNFGADIAHAPAFMSDADCARERVFGRPQQLVRALIDDSYGNSRSVIANPTIRNNADVELHYVAILNAPLAANTVDHFVVKGDANVAGKNAMAQPITQKGAFYAGVAHEVRSCLIHFLGCNSRANQIADPVEYVAGCAACLPHLLNFPGVLDRNHFAVLSSINFEMSAKTASRSRFPSIRCNIDSLL